MTRYRTTARTMARTVDAAADHRRARLRAAAGWTVLALVAGVVCNPALCRQCFGFDPTASAQSIQQR